MTAKSGLIYGFHAVTTRLKRSPEGVQEIYLSPARTDVRARALTGLAQQLGIRVMALDERRLDAMTGHARHQGLVAKVTGTAAQGVDLGTILDGLPKDGILLVLDGIQDPHNLGACLRVADAAGVSAVIAPRDRAVGLNATVAKVASGAAETVPYLTVTNLVRTLDEIREHGVWVVGADAAGEQDLFAAPLPSPVAWVMGAEGSGLRRLTREHCDVLVRIPLRGSVESLNVSVACGVCLYETRRQIGAAADGV